MTKQHVVSAIDIGTEKIVTVIADTTAGRHTIQVLGFSSVPAAGIRKSQIVDLNATIAAMTESVDAAERMAGVNIQSAYVSVSGAHIQSQNSKGVVAVAQPQQEISADDVARVIDAAKAVSLPTGKEIMHIVPKNFKVDSQEGIKDPIGMSGIRLEAEAHIVTGSSTALKNIEKCINEMGVQVSEFVFSGLASAESVLTETEKELGVVVVDIGAGSTSLCVYVEGSLEYSNVLPIGARHITQDIALGCRVSLQSAEKIKLGLAALGESPIALPGESKEDARKRRKREDLIEPQQLGITEPIDPLSRRMLVEGIMMPRMKEMFELIGAELEKNKLFAMIPAGIVLTGGGAETAEIIEMCKRTLQLPTRVGAPQGFRGLIDEVEKPSFATSLGLVLYGSKKGGELVQTTGKGFAPKQLMSSLHLPSLPGKLIRFIKSLLP